MAGICGDPVMRTRLDIPIVLRRVRFSGPTSRREIDMILDTGAVYTVIAWDVAKDIGYDPAESGGLNVCDFKEYIHASNDPDRVCDRGFGPSDV